jgi:hypothetical protein
MGGDSPEVKESFDRASAEHRAKLTREQWEDYKTRYQPWEDKLISFADDPTVKQQGVDYAKTAVDNTYNVGLGQYTRNRMRLGESPKLDALESRQLRLGKAKSMAQAVNDARNYADDRKEKVQTSGLSSAASTVRGG